MTIEKRLTTLEYTARLAERARADAWVQGLSDAELDAYIDDFRRRCPEDNARFEAMTDVELEAYIEVQWTVGHV